MRWITRLFFALIVILIIAVALVVLYRKELVKRYRPTVEQLGDVNFHVVNDTSYVQTKLVVLNRSFIRIEMDTLRYKISLFDKVYIDNAKHLDVLLQAYGSDTLDVQLKIPSTKLIHDLRSERKSSDSANYEVNLFLQYSTFFGKAELPINKASRVKIPTPPELEILDIKYEKLRRKYILANAEVKVINHNNVALTVRELKYSMKVEEQGDLNGRYDQVVVIKPFGTCIVQLPLKITMKNVGHTLWDVVRDNDTYPYTLTIQAKLESTDPIKEIIYFDLTKSGKMELKK